MLADSVNVLVWNWPVWWVNDPPCDTVVVTNQGYDERFPVREGHRRQIGNAWNISHKSMCIISKNLLRISGGGGRKTFSQKFSKIVLISPPSSNPTMLMSPHAPRPPQFRRHCMCTYLTGTLDQNEKPLDIRTWRQTNSKISFQNQSLCDWHRSLMRLEYSWSTPSWYPPFGWGPRWRSGADFVSTGSTAPCWSWHSEVRDDQSSVNKCNEIILIIIRLSYSEY